jgi:hypothetical protein
MFRGADGSLVQPEVAYLTVWLNTTTMNQISGGGVWQV